MKGLILAAGRGERLRPLTLTTPKPLLELGGFPLIHYALRMLQRAGITEVAINTHHLGEQIPRRLGDGSSWDMRIHYAPEQVLLGTGGPLLGLQAFFGDEPFVVANSDNLIDLDLTAMVEFHTRRRALATFALYRPENLDQYSRLEVDGDGRLRRIRFLRRARGFEDHPPQTDGVELASYMFCGVYVCDPKVYAWMPRRLPLSSIQDVFAPLLTAGQPLYGYLHPGWFRTVDDLDTYRTLQMEFDRGLPPSLL